MPGKEATTLKKARRTPEQTVRMPGEADRLLAENAPLDEVPRPFDASATIQEFLLPRPQGILRPSRAEE